jgi:hypothetical protein
VFGHSLHVSLKDGKALLERRKLLKELFLGDLLFRETAFAFDVSVEKTFHDDAPLYSAESCVCTSRLTSSAPSAYTCATESDRHGNAQECRRNGGGILAWAFVLAVKQDFQFLLQITGPTVVFRGLECIHGWPIVFSECIDEF